MSKLLEAEVNVMKLLKHENIIGFKDIIQSTQNYYIVMEYCN